MNGKKFMAAAALIFVLVFVCAALGQTQAQGEEDKKTPYPAMAALDQYGDANPAASKGISIEGQIRLYWSKL